MTDDELLAIKANNLLHKNYILDIKSELKAEIDISKRCGDYKRKQAATRALNLIEAFEYVLDKDGKIYD